MSNILRKPLFTVTLTVLLSSGVSHGALAGVLETGKCSPAAEVRAALSAQGQNPIIVGNRTGYGYDTAFVFMANEDGSRGYLTRGDKPLGQPAETICIDSVYSNVRLNDIAKPGIPEWAKLGGNPEAAKAVCSRDKLGYQEECSFYDTALSNLNGNGQLLMFQAKGTAINPRDKTIRSGQLIAITLNPTAQEGLVTAATLEGAGYMISAYTKASYTQHGEKLLDK